MESRADLHVHSRYSDRPSEWVLRRIGAPESFVSPRDLHASARRQGMEFVTITDHNSIRGALEIADLPGTFLSSEVTSYFPDDGCKVHILVFGLTEVQFEAIQEVRQDIRVLRDYLVDQRLAHSVAHPTFAVNNRLTVAHIEQLLVLFNTFEALNGTRQARANRLVEVLLAHLTPEMVAEMAAVQALTPTGAEPWRKALTGGSDDHSGCYVASAHTLTPPAASVTEFLEHLRAGRHAPAGQSGTAVRFAHSLYHIAYSYYRDRLASGRGGHSKLIEALLQRLTHTPPPAPESFPFLRSLKRTLLRPLQASRLSPVEERLAREFSGLLAPPRPGAVPQPAAAASDKAFAMACRLSHGVGYHFLQTFATHLGNASLLESLQSLAALAPVGLAIAPYLTAYATQHKDDRLMTDLEQRFAPLVADLPPTRKAWITDTFDDVNGVAMTVRRLTETARQLGRDLTVLTCLEKPPVPAPEWLMNFTPVGMLSMPEYPSQQLAFPPFLEVVEYLERGQFSEVIISTPGPLGLTGLAAARLLGLRTAGIYHTDFPEYVRVMTDDDDLAQLAGRFMWWFYGQMDMVFVPSEWYRQELRDNGLDQKPIEVLPRGVDTALFRPERRDPEFLHQFGGNGHFKFLYAGRVSPEKNLGTLVDAFDDLTRGGCPAELVIVGDGPLLPELRARCAGRADVVFTGFLRGEALASAYASADAFVFPSTSDTFGNVVLEAQACGLPAIVSNQGGPQEIVREHRSGLIVDMATARPLRDAMATLYADADLRRAISERALANARERSWPRILESFWQASGKGARR
jgi:glycosyltransferase involved in cell wall biosynthesis/predicted metal-dependent phosphoesterase TrpH